MIEENAEQQEVAAEEVVESQEAVETPEVAVAPEWTEEQANEARALGWKSPDEWDGAIPKGYIDNPSRYLEHASRFTPFRRQESQFNEKFAKLEAANAKAMEMQREMMERDFQQREAEIIARQRTAVKDMDSDAFDKAERDRAALAGQRVDTPEHQPEVNHAEMAAIETWAVSRPWFNTDQTMRQAANHLYGEAMQNGMTTPEGRLAYVDSEMGKRFVGYNGAPKAKTKRVASAVDGGLSLGSKGPTKLPKECEAPFERFAKQGLFTDDEKGRAKFMETYNNA